MPDDPHYSQPGQRQPEQDDRCSAPPVDRSFAIFPRFYPAYLHYFFRNELERQEHAQGDEQQIVQVTEHGDEVGDQIDWAEGIRHHQCGPGFGVPGRARVAVRQIEGIRVSFEILGGLFEFIPHAGGTTAIL